jgi:RNA polymerase sigma-70 factor (ECF subfamily)
VTINEAMAAPGNQPDLQLIKDETEEKVQTAIGHLKIDHRVIIVLKHFADLSYREISYILEIPEKTVKSRLFTARRQLGGILVKKGWVKND